MVVLDMQIQVVTVGCCKRQVQKTLAAQAVLARDDGCYELHVPVVLLLILLVGSVQAVGERAVGVLPQLVLVLPEEILVEGLRKVLAGNGHQRGKDLGTLQNRSKDIS